MNLEDFFKSKKVKVIAACICGFLVLIIVFASGVFVGMEKTRFSYRSYDEGFRRDMIGRPAPMHIPLDNSYLNAHGLVGIVNSASGNLLTIRDIHGLDKTVAITSQTVIDRDDGTTTPAGIKTGDHALVIGQPNSSGQLEATLIRIK